MVPEITIKISMVQGAEVVTEGLGLAAEAEVPMPPSVDMEEAAAIETEVPVPPSLEELAPVRTVIGEAEVPLPPQVEQLPSVAEVPDEAGLPMPPDIEVTQWLAETEVPPLPGIGEETEVYASSVDAGELPPPELPEEA